MTHLFACQRRRAGAFAAALLVLTCCGGKDTAETNPDGGAGADGAAGLGGAAGAAVAGAGGAAGRGGASGGAAGGATQPTSACGTAGQGGLPAGVQLVADAVDVRHLVVAGGFAYWTTETLLQRVAVAGGAPVTVLDRSGKRNHLGWLTVEGSTIYVTETGVFEALGVAKLPVDGSAPPLTIAPGTSMWHVLVSGEFTYFYNAAEQAIGRVPTAGGAPTTLVRDVSPTEMAIANGQLFFIHPKSNGSEVHLLRVPVDARAPAGGAAQTGAVPAGAQSLVRTDNYETNGVVTDDTSIYWDEGNKVMKIAQTGGATTTIDTLPDHPGNFGLSNKTNVGQVVAAGTAIYWTSSLRCGAIYKASTTGENKTTLVANVASPQALAVDGTHVYFISGEKLLRVPR